MPEATSERTAGSWLSTPIFGEWAEPKCQALTVSTRYRQRCEKEADFVVRKEDGGIALLCYSHVGSRAGALRLIAEPVNYETLSTPLLEALVMLVRDECAVVPAGPGRDALAADLGLLNLELLLDEREGVLVARLPLTKARLRELGVSEEDIAEMQHGGWRVAGQSEPEAVNKWHNRECGDELFGTTEWFQSEWEREVWYRRVAQERAGEIRELKRQVAFRIKIGRVFICTYVADFTYKALDQGQEWQLVVEDAKGKPTRDYVLKRKLMLAVLGIPILETYRPARGRSR